MRSHISEPVGKCMFIYIPRVFERTGTLIAEDMSIEVPALLVVANVFDAGKRSSRIIKAEPVEQEEATFQPFERGLPADLLIGCEVACCQFPDADHHIQSPERGMRPGG